MIKLIIVLTSVLLLTSLTNRNINPSEDDKDKVETNVIAWADSIFYHHEEYRFEQFKAVYTDNYQIAILRLDMYLGKQKNLEKTKQKGFYKKSEEEYLKEHKAIVEKNKSLKKIVDNFENKADHYQILFWSNIKTNQGPTVYYSHLIKLDNDFNVISATVKSEIGKKNDKTKILYSKDVKNKK